MFIDSVTISVASGRGGDGCVSFRREKYVPNGGPDGGDGGKGGSVYFVTDSGQNTLSAFRFAKIFKAEDAKSGEGKNRHGKNGADLYIKVPPGTVIKEAQSEKVIVDMSWDMQKFLLLGGGRGGKGNAHFATSTMQAPKYAQPGQPERTLSLTLELKVIADVGLVGFPNVGKSTILTKISNARPKVANYHFTTINPHLGVVDLGDAKSFVVADIPGLIEGASNGSGLGHAFLQHIERTRLLIHVVDVSGFEGRDPLTDIHIICAELRAYNPALAERPYVIAANKCDMLTDSEQAERLLQIKEHFAPREVDVFALSALTGKGIRELLYAVSLLLDKLETKPRTYEAEYFPEEELTFADEPYSVSYDADADAYVVEGPKIEKMLGYTNLEAEKGFIFFQRFLKEAGVFAALEEQGISEGATVRMYGFDFEYYK